MKALLFFMALAVGAFWHAAGFPDSSNYRSGNFVPGPAFFPQLLSIVLFLACGIEALRDWRNRKKEEAKPPVRAGGLFRDWGLQNMFIIAAFILVFALFIEDIGFAIPAFAMTFVVVWRLKAGLVKSAAFSVAGVYLVMLFFHRVFAMYFPEGWWSPPL
jgi:hypothetical protein